MQKILFGAGCFWGVEEYFANILGVKKTTVGYSGGFTKDPNYESVCSGNTGHVEVVSIEFDEKIISFDQLLNHFWNCHDPTTFNKQGPDIGEQYKSIVFYYDDFQNKMANKSKIQKQKNFNKKIVTEIKKADNFYIAEDYHQRFLKKN